MWPQHGADAVNGVLVVAQVGFKSAVYRLLEGLQTMVDANDVGTEHLHAGDVGSLLGDIDCAHVDFTFQAEIGSCGGQRHAVLAGAGFGDNLLLAHEFGEQTFAHAVVELVGTGVVEVFALQVNLRTSYQAGEPFAMVHRSGASLELLADTAKLVDELGRLADVVIGIGNFLEGGFQLLGEVGAAKAAVIAVCTG